MLDAKKELVNAIRPVLAKDHPEIQKLYGEFNFWSNVSKVLQDTAKRKTGQEGGLTTKLGTAAVVGGQIASRGLMRGAAFYAGVKVAQSAAYRTFTAVERAKLADAIASGNAGAVTRLAGKLGGGAAAESGR